MVLAGWPRWAPDRGAVLPPAGARGAACHLSRDSIAYDGRTLIGHGLEPDVAVMQKQSDLLAGKDSVHEAGLSWFRRHRLFGAVLQPPMKLGRR